MQDLHSQPQGRADPGADQGKQVLVSCRAQRLIMQLSLFHAVTVFVLVSQHPPLTALIPLVSSNRRQALSAKMLG